MKMYIYFILLPLATLMILSSAGLTQPPDTLWTQTYGGIDDDYGQSVQQTQDEGYIIAGYTGPSGGSPDVYLIKTDAAGNALWTSTFGPAYTYDMGYSVQQTDDGGYIIAGQTSNPLAPTLVYDVYLIKTDASGNLEWTRNFGGNSNECGYSVQQTADGGYIIAGYTQSYGAGQSDIYLIKTNASGVAQWTRTYGGSSNDYGYCVHQTQDGGYIIAGHTYSYGVGESNVWLIKTDASGDSLWTRDYGGVEPDIGRSVQQTPEGGYIIAGSSKSYGAGAYDVYLIKTDASGNQEWSQTFGGTNYDMGYSVQLTQDGGYIVVGDSASYGTGVCNAYLVKTNASGSQMWSRTFGGSGSDYGRSGQQTSDDGYILAGYTNSYGAGNYDVYLIRLAAEISDLSVTLTPHDPPIQIPTSGGSFQYDLAIENITTGAVVADAWIDITPPGGPVAPLIVRLDITFPANTTISRADLNQNVPPNAPAGVYTYTCSVGEVMGTIIDSDHFTFEKLATGEGPATITPPRQDWNLSGWEEEVFVSTPTPEKFAFIGAYPNPFNLTTAISYQLSALSFVNLSVYDISGQKVVELVNGWREAGVHEVIFDGSGMVSGIYIYSLRAGDASTSRKMVLMK